MKPSSNVRGTNTSYSEVTIIESLGFWLLADDQEYFVPYSDYSVFKNATIEQILNLQRLAPGQYHWPDLDADIELEALQNPEHYPLTSRQENPPIPENSGSEQRARAPSISHFLNLSFPRRPSPSLRLGIFDKGLGY